MASSKVMASTSPPNPDRPRQTSPSSPLLSGTDQTRNFGSMSMEEILKNIYSDSDSFTVENNGIGGGDAVLDGGGAGGGMRNGSGDGDGNRTVDEVWREIVIGGGTGGGEPAMTLEDFLTKAGAVSEEDVRIPVVTMESVAPVPPATAVFSVDATVNSVVDVEAARQFAPAVCMQNGSTGGGYGMEFGNGMVVVGRSGGGSGRGKRRAVEEVVLDKATQQKQRRMIKNRESAARSRERKQAYTVELETLVTQLEDEKARLLRDEAEQNRKRYKQLMENLIPVVEGKRPPRVLRRVRSMNL
ncbi:G-box-binding factor 4-like [Olea europaea subsp. europaea]|uniref:G-box-binding factor 4-like n=1 Tax=Olea europaea subsp. europaea TaxID=158383 RepID=A0A8S0V4S8_OLEEU|nr:G-box-binding factor 4-like [Olea europaea subsp. europaea]